MKFSKFVEVDKSVLNTLKELKDIISEFKVNHPDALIYLFGSCARGQAIGISDVDIAIITKDSLHWSERSVFSTCYNTSKEVNFTYILKEDFDVLDMLLYTDIKREGILWEKLVMDLQL